MRIQRPARQVLLAPALICAAGLVVAACGSGGGSGSATPSSPSSATAGQGGSGGSGSGPAGQSGAQAQIKANWEAFFLSSTPTARRVMLLENGTQFQQVIKAQSKSPLASSATAKVTKVTVTSATQAKVAYNILLNGAPALTGQNGVAVKQDGTWKVGDTSFCGLLAVENGGKTSSLPPACH